MNNFKHGLFGFALIFFSHSGFSLPIENDAVFVRVIDTGAGLATVTRMPGGHYMIYDAGHWTGKPATMDAIKSVYQRVKTLTCWCSAIVTVTTLVSYLKYSIHTA